MQNFGVQVRICEAKGTIRCVNFLELTHLHNIIFAWCFQKLFLVRYS